MLLVLLYGLALTDLENERSTIQIEGITINMPLIIEVIDSPSKIEPLLVEIKRMVGDNGLVTLHEVDGI